MGVVGMALMQPSRGAFGDPIRERNKASKAQSGLASPRDGGPSGRTKTGPAVTFAVYEVQPCGLLFVYTHQPGLDDAVLALDRQSGLCQRNRLRAASGAVSFSHCLSSWGPV